MLGYEASASAAEFEGEGEERAVITYSEASYHEIGRNLARSLWDYYKGPVTYDFSCVLLLPS